MFYPLIVGSLHYAPGYSLRRRHMDNYMVAYIQEGTLHCRLGSEELTVCAGQFLLIDCGQRHDFWTDVRCTDIYLHFNGLSAGPMYRYIVSRQGNVIAPMDADAAFNDLLFILELFRTGVVVDEPSVHHRIDGILSRLAQRSPTAHVAASIMAVVAYISENLSSDCSLDAWGRVACLGKYHLAKVFKAQIGVSPHRYVLNARMNRARYLLAYTTSTIQRIGRECGFDQVSSFCAAFKRETGMSPTAYRDKAAK